MVVYCEICFNSNRKLFDVTYNLSFKLNLCAKITD